MIMDLQWIQDLQLSETAIANFLQGTVILGRMLVSSFVFWIVIVLICIEFALKRIRKYVR